MNNVNYFSCLAETGLTYKEPLTNAVNLIIIKVNDESWNVFIKGISEITLHSIAVT